MLLWLDVNLRLQRDRMNALDSGVHNANVKADGWNRRVQYSRPSFHREDQIWHDRSF
jgi:hypothetical protein